MSRAGLKPQKSAIDGSTIVNQGADEGVGRDRLTIDEHSIVDG
jgi:hypothetical protein